MRRLTAAGRDCIADLARRHGFTFEASEAMLDAIVRGNGTMAQFDHPEFAGSGQWMRGGMTMISDMFNDALKGRVNALCAELSELVSKEPGLISPGSFQSQRQGTSARGKGDDGSSHDEAPNRPSTDTGTTLFEPADSDERFASSSWWPVELQAPSSSGAQNGVRYAYFADKRRLAIQAGESVTVYDTLGHHIEGVSQQQSAGSSLLFFSQDGPVDMKMLPIVWSSREPAMGAAGEPSSESSVGDDQDINDGKLIGRGGDLLKTIERLAELKLKGVLTEEEFATKKAELLRLIR